MIRRPPRSTLDRSSAASDVYKRQVVEDVRTAARYDAAHVKLVGDNLTGFSRVATDLGMDSQSVNTCLLYTSDAADERSSVDLGGRRIIKKKKKKRKAHGTRMTNESKTGQRIIK